MGLLITSNRLDMLKLMDADENKSKRLVSLMKKRGFIQPAFELYGGVAGLYDYGPLGGRLRRNVISKWLNHWISLGNIVEIDSPTITPEPVLKASGHIGAFNDYASECKSCNSIFRTDHLLEGYHNNPDALDNIALDNEIENAIDLHYGISNFVSEASNEGDSTEISELFDETRIVELVDGIIAQSLSLIHI